MVFSPTGRYLASDGADNKFIIDRPIAKDGEVKPDPARVKARQDAQVRAALKSGPVAVIVLGSSHDQSDSMRAVSGQCAYLRVTTERSREVAQAK